MDIGTVLAYIGSALGGGGIIELFHWRTQKKKATEEVKSDELDNIHKSIDVYKTIIDSQNERIAQLQNENKELRQELEELRRELNELRSRAMFRNTNRGKDGKYIKIVHNGTDD